MPSPMRPESIALLQSPCTGVISTFRKDGSILNVMAWVDADDEGNVLLNTAEGRGWLRNVERDRRVTVTAIRPHDPLMLEWISVTGSLVAADRGAVAIEHLNALSFRHYGSDFPYSAPGEVRVKLTIAPRHINHFGSGTSV